MLHIIDLQLCHDVISSCLLDLSDASSPREKRLQELSAEYEVWCAEQRDMAQVQSMGAERCNLLISTFLMYGYLFNFPKLISTKSSVFFGRSTIGLQVSHLLPVHHGNCSLRRS